MVNKTSYVSKIVGHVNQVVLLRIMFNTCVVEILYQWEKLHAFASDRQLQSQQLSTLYKCSEDVQVNLDTSDVPVQHYKFSCIREMEHFLMDVKVTNVCIYRGWG
jgi:hypothetical protein